MNYRVQGPMPPEQPDEKPEARKLYTIPPEGIIGARFLSGGRFDLSFPLDMEQIEKRPLPSCFLCERFPESVGKTTLDLQLRALSRSFEPLRLQLTRSTQDIAEFLLRIDALKHSRKKNRLPRKLKKRLKKEGFSRAVPYRRGGVHV